MKPSKLFLGTWVLGLLLLGGGGLLGGAALAQPVAGSGSGSGMELTPPVLQALRQIGEGAIQWNKAFLQDDRDVAKRELERVLQAANGLGMESLPDLSLSAVSLAVEAAETGDFSRAAWALEAAEELDPGRPETLFGESLVARLRGSYLQSLTASMRGYLRLFGFPQERGLFWINLLFWGLATVALSSALFLILQIALKGQAVGLDLQELLGRFLPGWLAFALTVIILGTPLLLPHGLFWFLLVWSLILWGYGSLQERLVLIVIWLFFGVVPLALDQVERRLAVVTSPAYQVTHNLRDGRLYGRLFTDLEVLNAILPKSVAVRHLEADFHSRLGAMGPGSGSLQRDLGIRSGQLLGAQQPGGVFLHPGRQWRRRPTFRTGDLGGSRERDGVLQPQPGLQRLVSLQRCPPVPAGGSEDRSGGRRSLDPPGRSRAGALASGKLREDSGDLGRIEQLPGAPRGYGLFEAPTGAAGIFPDSGGGAGAHGHRFAPGPAGIRL